MSAVDAWPMDMASALPCGALLLLSTSGSRSLPSRFTGSLPSRPILSLSLDLDQISTYVESPPFSEYTTIGRNDIRYQGPPKKKTPRVMRKMDVIYDLDRIVSMCLEPTPPRP